MDSDRDFVSIVIFDNESIIEKETRVAFLAVGVEDLVVTRNVLTRLNHKASLVISVSPARFSWSLVVEHVSHWHKPISLLTLDIHPKDT